MSKKKKITLDDWFKPGFPRRLTGLEQVIFDKAFKEGHDKGFNNGRISGHAEGKKAIESELKTKRQEARLRLVNAAGQAFDAISRALHEDSVSGTWLDR
jgi:hypothetical protein